MFRRYFFSAIASVALIFSATVLVSAQSGALRGHVVMKQADGTKVPAADAAIDVFRTDVSAKYTTKTDKKGSFVFAGLPFVGTYIIAASKEGAAPNWIQQIKVGREVDYEIELTPGDGRRLTQEEIKAASAQSRGPASSGSGGAKEAAEEKAKREEALKKNAEINKKIDESNVVVERTFKAGNEAYKAKNYDAAISQFDEGLAADPEHPGAPALLTNKAVALKDRAVMRYNSVITSDAYKAALQKGDASGPAMLEPAKADWKLAFESATKAVEMLKKESPPTEPSRLENFNKNKYFALLVRTEAVNKFVGKVDRSQVDVAVSAYQEYIAAESDPAKKAKAQVQLAELLLEAGAGERALAQYQSILAEKPNDPDANLGAGLALYSTGEKEKYQEAANYLQRFVDNAPDTHKEKETIKAVLAELKNTEKIVPEKTAPPARRRRP